MAIISAQLCFEKNSFLLKDHDGNLIDFPELFYLFSAKYKDLIKEKEISCISLAHVSHLKKVGDSGEAAFSFTVVFWKRFGTNVFTDNQSIYNNTLNVGISCLDMIDTPGEDDIINYDVLYFEDLESDLRKNIFADVNDFLAEILDGITYTNLEAEIQAGTYGLVDFQTNGFSIVIIEPILVKIVFNMKYDQVLTTREILPYVNTEIMV